ncbi:MAG: OsmC family protein [Bacteroidota bacterium]
MTNKVKIQWERNMLFNVDSIGGSFKIDANSDVGGEGLGPRPKALMLSSLAGCTGMDVISLLKKMRAEVDNLEIDVTGELTDVHPKYYHKVHVEYRFYGKDFKKDKIEKSVNLSQDRYCGVSEMFRQFAELTHEIKYIEQ